MWGSSPGAIASYRSTPNSGHLGPRPPGWTARAECTARAEVETAAAPGEAGFRSRPQILPNCTTTSGRTPSVLVHADSHAQWWTSESMSAHVRVYLCARPCPDAPPVGTNSLSAVEWQTMESAMPLEERQTHKNLSLWLQDRRVAREARKQRRLSSGQLARFRPSGWCPGSGETRRGMPRQERPSWWC